LLARKIAVAKKEAAKARAGKNYQNSKSGFSSKKVRILTKRHRQFFILKALRGKN